MGSLVRSVHRAELLTMTRFGNADAAELDSDDDYVMTQADYEELRQLTKQQGGRPAATPTKRDVSALAYQEFSRATRESQRRFRIHEHVLVAERAILASDLFFGEHFFHIFWNLFKDFLNTTTNHSEIAFLTTSRLFACKPELAGSHYYKLRTLIT